MPVLLDSLPKIHGLTPDGVALRTKWLLQARDAQLPPLNDWVVWWLRSGRGFGKTRTGAEWLADQMRKYPNTRWAIIAPTQGDVRDICFLGESGLLSVLSPDEIQGDFNKSELTLTLRNGAKVKGFSSEKPNRLRGPQHHGVWAEEVSSWENADDTWSMMEFGLRLKLPDAKPPQIVCTSTPKQNDITKKLSIDPQVHVTTGSTYDNEENLDPSFLARIKSLYEGTRLGMQELDGQLLEDVEGALWQSEWIKALPETYALEYKMTRVGWDPAVTSKHRSGKKSKKSDAHGIIAVGLSTYDDLILIQDKSGIMTPVEGARRAISLAQAVGSPTVIMEDNQGKDTWLSVWKEAGGDKSGIKLVPEGAKASKEERAIPLATVFEKAHNMALVDKVRKVYCVNMDDLKFLLAEMVSWDPSETKESPNRIDGLVWAAFGVGIKQTARAKGIKRAGRLSELM